MNLIADNAYSVTMTDVAHVLQLLSCPDTSCRVVGVAQQEDSGFLVGTACLKILPVNLKTLAIELQTALADLATVVADGREETVVVRTEHHDLLARHRQCLHCA